MRRLWMCGGGEQVGRTEGRSPGAACGSEWWQPGGTAEFTTAILFRRLQAACDKRAPTARPTIHPPVRHPVLSTAE